ncbi:hypothetical protein [Bacillus sp. E214]|uniref:hypothetical protein n=1 Tax=Bacillus sp. E214 TaxID=2587156 RepID=UPI001651EB25|nr:hypothetical protein [Bacillus sp. E214]
MSLHLRLPDRDGIHFGLLTDFGAVTDLEEAYVVYVSPMDFGSAVFLAARNLKEFTNLLFTMKDAIEIGNFLSIDMADEGEEREDEAEFEYDEEEFLQEREYVLGKLKESLNCTVIQDVKSYYKNLFKERKQQIAIHTQDGIGVIPISNQPITRDKYELEEDVEIDVQDLQAYFQKASVENKLAYVRDAQTLGIIMDDEEVREFVLSELRELGYKIEADRLQRSNESD